MMLSLTALMLVLAVVVQAQVSLAPFAHSHWKVDEADSTPADEQKVNFIVIVRKDEGTQQELHDRLMRVSNPRSVEYGDYLSAEDIQSKYSPSQERVNAVVGWLQEQLPESSVEVNLMQDMIRVQSQVDEIEAGLKTTLRWHAHSQSRHRYLRSVTSLSMPEDIQNMVSIVSLNSPIHSLTTQAGRQMARGYDEMAAYVEAATAAYNISVTPGNEEAILSLTAICSDGSVNGDDVPCSSIGSPVSTVSVSVVPQNSKYSTLTRTIDVSTMMCYNSATGALCGGSSENCVCYGKVAPVPKYTTYHCEVEATFDDASTKSWGVSYNFTLTDVATPEFLSDLYDIPYGLNVRHGSTQAVAEWYNESWNPTDLYDFLKLVGMKPQHIAVDNVYGNNPPSQYLVGGEAQLDVEYIMALAPGMR